MANQPLTFETCLSIGSAVAAFISAVLWVVAAALQGTSILIPVLIAWEKMNCPSRRQNATFGWRSYM